MSITDTTSSPHVKLRSFALGASRWTGGLWGERFAVVRDALVPEMGKLMRETQRVRFLGNLEAAAGMCEQPHRGPKWNDGDFYKWLESACAMYAQTRDGKLETEIGRCIKVIAAAQRADGYIHSDVQIRQRHGEEVREFGNPMDFEMYNMGHLMTAACVHYRATGKRTLLEVANRAADFLTRTFADPKPEQARHGICPSHLMGLVELYRVTGERARLELAGKLLAMRDLVVGGDDDNQDRIRFRQQREAHGHAVRATYLYAGVADIYAETGDAGLMETLSAVWEDLVSKKLYITGGCGALFDGASPDGAEDQSQITRVHQAFGRAYQLPQSTAHNETCAAIGNLLWNWRMLQITGKAKFGDVVEQTLFNSVLAGVSLDGRRFFYTNTLRQVEPMPVALRWPRTRQEWMSCYCCPPNVARVLAESSSFAWLQSERGVAAVVYGSCELTTDEVQIRQESDYPWDGVVRLTFVRAPRGEFALSLRIPAWARGATVDGKAADAGTFVEVRRRWRDGDQVTLVLPMETRMVEAHPLVEENRGQVAVVRGPVVYCVESPDLPAGVGVMDVSLPRGAKFATAKRDGLVALAGKGFARERGKWAGLYRALSDEPAREIDVVLIPYFAWDNRGTSEMTVWIPLRDRS